jgi:xanthine dehydrogenase/oxidase
VIECCNILKANLDPIRKLMPPQYTWQDLIAKAFSMGVDLCARYWLYPSTPTPFQYNVYGAAVSEALIDVLTGETQIARVDILYDCGQT